MFTDKRILRMLAVLLILVFALAACQPAAQETQGPSVEPTKAPEKAATTAPTAAPVIPTIKESPYDSVDPTGTTVMFWHQHTRARETALQEIVADFNATNEWGITVEAQYQGGYSDIFNKMLTFMNTTDAPNLVVAYQNQAATYQLAQSLVDMNQLVDSEKWGLSLEEQADFFPGFWAQDVFPTFGNARLAFPPNRSMEVLYYNIDWLEELGYDGPPTTPC
jgi:multiple sugar transport system substrate-binding protein/sn-glycerol 3-phosphate transport system substrate-binding protein